MHRVIITGPAKRDIQADYDWWSENHSAEQAERWYLGIHAAVQSLRDAPERCSGASETDLVDLGVRQLLFGLGRRATHRIVFAIDSDTVVVLRVRHTSQDALSVEALTQDS
jgi:plasmid stabilization system protein ParE